MFLSKTMSVLIAGHLKVKYLNQYTQDPHVLVLPGQEDRLGTFFLINEVHGYHANCYIHMIKFQKVPGYHAKGDLKFVDCS